MMYQPSLFGNVVFGRSTSSAAVSRVKTSQRQGEARALRAAARVYGERCSGLSAKSDPVGCSLRMFLLSACEELTGLSLRWKESATPAGHWWLALGRSARRTKGIEFGLLPIAQTGLTQQVEMANWPTPNATDYKGPSQPPGRRPACDDDLPSRIMRDWPTPQAQDTRHSPSNSQNRINKGGQLHLSHYVGQANQGSRNTIGKPRGSLNAEWVAQLMGFPQEYTQGLIKACCEYSETHGATRSPG